MTVSTMQAASRAALAATEHRLDEVLTDHGVSPAAVGEQLHAFAEMLAREVSLRRALADASAAEDARKGLLRQLVAGKLDEPAVEVLDAAVTSRWSTPRQLLDGVRIVAWAALLVGAERDGDLETVERELFGAARVLAKQPRLEQAMSDQAASAEAKRELVRELFANKVNPTTQTLIEQAALAPRGRAVQHGLDDLAQLAARRREQSVAHVVTAVPLTDEQVSTLTEKLTTIYGRSIAVHVENEPDVVGGLVVKVGDEVIDGSSAGRIMAARGQLA